MVKILYEDNHLLVLDKPAGMLTQPSGTKQPSLEEQAKNWIKLRDGKSGNVFLEPIHRLDRPVSGIVLFAKSRKALSRLQAAFREKKIRKTYWGLVEGHPPQDCLLEHYLRHGDYQCEVVDAAAPGAKLSSLHLRFLRADPPYSLVEIELKTGRYHQIRAQLAAIGCPIVGDRKYGSCSAWENKEGIALQHVRMEFPHPTTHQIIDIRPLA